MTWRALGSVTALTVGSIIGASPGSIQAAILFAAAALIVGLSRK